MSHIAGEELSAYWLGELAEGAASALEEHVFACDACAAAWSRTRRVIEAVRALVPPVVSAARLRELRAQVPALPEVVVDPGGYGKASFGRSDQFFLLRLQAELRRAERVDFSIELPGGPTLFALPAVPFDAETGAVLVLCQRHFVSAGPVPQVYMRLRGVESDGQTVELGLYTIDHELSL